MAMYEYEWKMDIDFEGDTEKINRFINTRPQPTQDEILHDLTEGLKHVALEKFVEGFAQENRWISVKEVRVENFRDYTYKMQMDMLFNDWIRFRVKATIYVMFETDIAETEEHSPSLLHSILKAIYELIVAFSKAHPVWFGLIVFISFIVVISVVCRLTGTSLWTPITPTGGSEWIIAGAVLLLAALGIYVIYEGKGKGKRRR
jgi:uncharacterized membrane protein YgdD (TMEM256/DUF423 family)